MPVVLDDQTSRAHMLAAHTSGATKEVEGYFWMQGQQDQQAEAEQTNGHAEGVEEGTDPVRQFMRPPPNRPTVSSEHLPLQCAICAASTESLQTQLI